MRRTPHLPALAVLTLFGLVACSSDDKSSATTPAPPAVTEGVDSTDPDTTTGTTPVSTDDTIDPSIEGSGVGTPFCDANTALNETDFPLETATPDEIQAFYEDVMPGLLEDLVDVTPPELEADVEVLIDGATAFGEILADNDWNFEAAFADPALGEVIADEEFSRAGERVDAYCAES